MVLDSDSRTHAGSAEVRPQPETADFGALLTPEATAILTTVRPDSRARLHITGASGSGRSGVTNHWLAGYRRRHPSTFVFAHSTDGRADNRDPDVLTWRLLQAVKSHCGLRDPVPHDAEVRREALPNWLARAAARAGALIVVDGLDGFDPGSTINEADIFPRYQPHWLSLIVTDDRRRPPGDGWHTLHLQALGRSSVASMLNTRAAALQAATQDTIIRTHACTNPLFLHMLLSVLNARPERVVQLDRWLKCSNPQALSELVLKTSQAELEESGEDAGLMGRVLRLLWAARDGLEEDGLRAWLEVSTERWRYVAAALAPLVDDGGGRWRLAYKSLREAVAALYLRERGQRQAAHLALAQWLTEAHVHDTGDTDLPWHLARAGQTDALRRHLSDPRLLAGAMSDDRRFELQYLWQQAGTPDDMARACRSAVLDLDHAIPSGNERARMIIDIAAFLREASPDADLDELYACAQSAIESDPTADDTDRAAVRLAHGAYRNARGDWSDAEPLLRAAHAVLERQATHELATLHEARGELTKAQTLYRAALTAYERELGADHPDLLPHLANLAALLRARHRFDDAEPLCQRALHIAETRLGNAHPTTAACVDRLAALRYAVNDYEQAEELYRRGLALNETIFGPRHPATAAALHNLGTVLDARAAFREAESLHRRALDIREAVLGPEHEDTAISVHNLAAALDAMGRYPEAEPLYRRAIAIWEKLVGSDHPATATSVNNLADLLRERGGYAEAEALYRGNIETWRRLVGEDHPNTLTTLIELGGLYADMGQLEQAEPLLWHGVEISEQVMGAGSLVHINAVCKLGALLRDDGRREAARALLQKTWAAAEGTLDMISPRLQKLRRQLEALDRK